MKKRAINVLLLAIAFSLVLSCKKKDIVESSKYSNAAIQGTWNIQEAKYQYYYNDTLRFDTVFYGPMPDTAFVELGPSFFRRITFSGDQMIVTSSGIALEKDTFQYNVGYECLLLGAQGTAGPYKDTLPIGLSDSSLTIVFKFEVNNNPKNYFNLPCRYQRAK